MNSIDAVKIPADSVSESGSIGLSGKADSFSIEDFKLLLAMSAQGRASQPDSKPPLGETSESSAPEVLAQEVEEELKEVSENSPEVLFAVLRNYVDNASSHSPAISAGQSNLPLTLPDHSATKSEFLDFLTEMELMVASTKSPRATKDLGLLQTWIQKLQHGEPKPMAVAPAPQESTLGVNILSTFLGKKEVANDLSSTDQPSYMPLASGPEVRSLGIPQANGVPAPRQEDLGSMITHMVDRMMVGDSRFHSKGEIQVKLADSILPQTELKLWRGEGGQLHVQFVSQSAEAAELLAARLPLLNARLNEQFSQGPNSLPVHVSLSQEGEMPQDGRSRQRYEPPVDENDLT